MDLTFQVLIPYCFLQHQTLLPSPVTSTTGWFFFFFFFLLWLFLFFLSGVISPLISNSIMSTYQPGKVIFQVSYLFAFTHCSWGSQGKNTEVVCHSLLQWITFCQNSAPWPVCAGWPHTAWLSFVELDKAVVRMIRLASCPWLWFQSVCPLSAYHLSGVSLTLDVGYLLMATAPDLGCGVSPLGHSPLQHCIVKRWCCESAAINMPANLENPAVATGLEKVSFHSSTKERQCQRMLKLPHNCNYLTC